MNASAAFENRKEQLAEALSRADTAEEAISALTMALEQVACELAQDEQDEHARQRQQAVLAALRSAPQLLYAADAKAELVLKETKNAPENRGQRMMRMAGVFLLAALAVYEAIDGHALFAALQLAGGGLLLAGAQAIRGPQEIYEARGRAGFGSDELIRRAAALCQAADVCVSDLQLLEKEAGAARLSGTADEAMIDLLVSLLEAKASGRDEVAMRSLAQAEQYLHMLGIEVCMYSAEHEALFDLLPTMGEARTIRPALIKEGRVLRRGTAACRMDAMKTREGGVFL